jgi:hypothetical protein
MFVGFRSASSFLVPAKLILMGFGGVDMTY